MNIELTKKLNVEFTNEEIEALKTAREIFTTIKIELEDNNIDDDETEDLIGEAWYDYERCGNCAISDIIYEVIRLAD